MKIFHPKKILFLSLQFSSIVAHADLTDTISRLKPSVVLVGFYSETDAPRFSFRGTGFIVASGNLAITNAHVLPNSVSERDKALAIQIWAPPNQWTLRLVRVVDIDRTHDLALLAFDGAAAPPLVLTSGMPREGTSVSFMGFPIGGALGFSHVTHRGIISSIAGIALPAPNSQQLNASAIQQLRVGSFEVLQLDATAYPGNSGGPIFDPETGAVLGVINSVLVKGSRESALSQPSGISYGIPVEHVQKLLRPVP